VVLYAGDNDLAAGKSPETVCNEFREFVKGIHAALPETRIVYLSIKPSLARAKLVEEQRTANTLIAERIALDPRLIYLDVGAPLLDADGHPRREYFVKDGLHLSKEGYEVWAQLLRPLLK
jgi:lysophospholipase L1-like esterase